MQDIPMNKREGYISIAFPCFYRVLMLSRILLILIVLTAINLDCVNVHSGKYIIYKSGIYGNLIREVPIWIDKGFTMDETDSIKEGIKEWNDGLNGWIKLDIVDLTFDMEDVKIKRAYLYGGWLIMKINGKNKMVDDDKNSKTLGFVDEIGGNLLYLIEERMNNEMIKYVTMHEIGHLLGLGHGGKYLMYSYYSADRFRCVDEDTMERIGRKWGIRKGLLNYCERIDYDR